MSLTIAREIALFEVLETPHNTSYYTTDGLGMLSAQTSLSVTATAAKTAILAFVDTLDSSSGLTELTTYLDRWITIGTQTFSIDGGAIGDMDQVTLDYNRERSMLKQRIQLIVPFFKYHEQLARQQGLTSASVTRTYVR